MDALTKLKNKLNYANMTRSNNQEVIEYNKQALQQSESKEIIDTEIVESMVGSESKQSIDDFLSMIKTQAKVVAYKDSISYVLEIELPCGRTEKYRTHNRDELLSFIKGCNHVHVKYVGGGR